MSDRFQREELNRFIPDHLGKYWRIIKEVNAPIPGWECDLKSWVVENTNTGERVLIESDHGKLKVNKKGIASLGDQIKEHKNCIREAKEAIHLLQGAK